MIVLRDTTERPEGIEAGTLKLAGTGETSIYGMVRELLTDKAAYEKMSRASNPYGDGLASSRIANALRAGAGRRNENLKRRGRGCGHSPWRGFACFAAAAEKHAKPQSNWRSISGDRAGVFRALPGVRKAFRRMFQPVRKDEVIIMKLEKGPRLFPAAAAETWKPDCRRCAAGRISGDVRTESAAVFRRPL